AAAATLGGDAARLALALAAVDELDRIEPTAGELRGAVDDEETVGAATGQDRPRAGAAGGDRSARPAAGGARPAAARRRVGGAHQPRRAGLADDARAVAALQAGGGDALRARLDEPARGERGVGGGVGGTGVAGIGAEGANARAAAGREEQRERDPHGPASA